MQRMFRREGEKLKDMPDKKRTHRLMAELRGQAGLRIGIIGVGRIGHLLATFLLQYADVYPNELYLVCIIVIDR
jgi:phosphoglycerate dehydrogenase-like enzyme